MRIRFVKSYTVKAEDGEVYKEGQQIDCNEASARHFINKGVAEEVGSTSASKAATEKPKADK